MRNSSASLTLEDCLTAAEMRPFLARSDGRAAWVTAFNLGVVAAAFALPALWLNPLTLLVLAVLLLGRPSAGPCGALP